MKTRDYNQSKYKTQCLAISSSWSSCFSVSHAEAPQFVPAGRFGDPGFLLPFCILDDFYSLLPLFLLIWSSVLDTNSNVLSGCIFDQAFWVIWLPISFVEIPMALWGCQLFKGHFPVSPTQSNFSVFLLSPMWTFYFTSPRNSWGYWYVHSKEYADHQVEAEYVQFRIPVGLPVSSKSHTWTIINIG